MPKKEPTVVSVPESAKKHLGRNIPTDWAGYCRQIRTKHIPGGFPPRGVNAKVFERMHRNQISICFPEGAGALQEVGAFATNLFDISVRYQALLITVDQTVSPVPVYEELRRVKRAFDQAVHAMEDETRDQVVVELAGYDTVEDIPISKDGFDGATSLAEKVSIAKRVLEVSRSQIAYMADHFDYKARLLGPGKPSVYAFAYAVFALADVFEEHDSQGRKAVVSEKVSSQEAHWTENYQYSGAFLDFVKAFFQTHDPQQIDDRSGSGFASGVRKLAQRRKKAPELHRLLNNDAGAQEVLDFMIGIDSLR